jgi:dienelactone hydrolase
MNNWQGDQLLQQLYTDTIQNHQPLASDRDIVAHQSKLRIILQQLIGTFQSNEVYSTRLLETVDCGTYIRQRIECSASPASYFAAYVLIPKHITTPLPAVIAIHGHGYGSREIVGLLPNGEKDSNEPGIHQHYAIQLVNRGLITIAPDVIGFGERRLAEDVNKDADIANSCASLSSRMLLMGKTLAGFRVHEMLKVLDILSHMPEVDADRIGMMGFSGGALIAYLTAALDQRIRATVLTGFTNTYQDSIINIHHCICNYIPDQSIYADLPEWIGLIAPRSLFVEAGRADPIFPVQGFQKAVTQIQHIYQQHHAESQFTSDLFEGAHEVSGRYAYDWIQQKLTTID